MGERIDREFKAHKKIVFIYPHTSVWDMVLNISYLFFDDTFKEVRKRIIVPVLDEVLQNVPGLELLSDAIGLVPVTKGGSLQRLYERLDQMDSFFVLISPKGSLAKKPWRSGWYNIAKKYDATLMVGGADYYEHRVKLEMVEKINGRSNEEMEALLKPSFANITPMIYGRETDLQDVEKPERSIISHNLLAFYLFTMFLAVIVLIFFLCQYMNEVYEFGSDRVKRTERIQRESSGYSVRTLY